MPFPDAYITVTGYTDRIGSHEYNLKLSARRAETVKSYLVEIAGIPADKVTAQGADGSDPVTKPDECPGQKRTPQLIACLQPDRRVDVEVVGSRLQAAPYDLALYKKRGLEAVTRPNESPTKTKRDAGRTKWTGVPIDLRP